MRSINFRKFIKVATKKMNLNEAICKVWLILVPYPQVDAAILFLLPSIKN